MKITINHESIGNIELTINGIQEEAPEQQCIENTHNLQRNEGQDSIRKNMNWVYLGGLLGIGASIPANFITDMIKCLSKYTPCPIFAYFITSLLGFIFVLFYVHRIANTLKKYDKSRNSSAQADLKSDCKGV